jgi:hypothetical protein
MEWLGGSDLLAPPIHVYVNDAVNMGVKIPSGQYTVATQLYSSRTPRLAAVGPPPNRAQEEQVMGDFCNSGQGQGRGGGGDHGELCTQYSLPGPESQV